MPRSSSQGNRDVDASLVGLLGAMFVTGLAALIYFLTAAALPNSIPGTDEWNQDQWSKWLWAVLGLLFLLQGSTGLARGRIDIGWQARPYHTNTRLEGAAAFTASTGTLLGGLLMLAAAAVYFQPSLGARLHLFGAVVSALASVFVGWLSGPLIRLMGY